MQIAQTSSARACCMAATVAGTVLTARYLGPEGRGVVAAATGWVTLFAMVAGLSISQVIYFVCIWMRSAPDTINTCEHRVKMAWT